MTANRYQDDQPTRLALLEQSLGSLKESLVKIDANMIRMETNMNKGFSDINKRIDDLSNSINNRLWRNFYFMVAGFASLFAIIGHGFKWF